MRAADATTVLRVLIAVAVVYGILAKFNPWALAAAIIILVVMDALDGFFALVQVSSGKVGFTDYVRASVFGNKSISKTIRAYKDKLSKVAPHGARFDVAGDRAVEYLFWMVFTYINIVPLLVFIIVILRHSFVDAMMASKGTSSKMKSRFARVVYASNFSRALINILKTATFAYLPFVYISAWPLWFGYVLIAALVFVILLRGAAEVYENLA